MSLSIESGKEDEAGDEAKGKVTKTLSWPHAALLCAKFQFGLGVWGIPTTMRDLGIIPGTISLILLSFVIIYCGILVTEMRLVHPEIQGLADVGYIVFGRFGGTIITSIFLLHILLIVGAGVLTFSIALNAISGHAICTAGFIAVAAGATLIIGAPLRRLQRLTWLGWIGLTCVVASAYVLVIALLVRSGKDVTLHKHYALIGHSDFGTTMCAIGLQILSLVANPAFYRISAEMHRPQQFTRSVCIGQAFVLINYLVIGLTVAISAEHFMTAPALGAAGSKIKRISYAIVLPGVLVSTLLYANVGAKCVELTVLRRFRFFRSSNDWIAWLTAFSLTIFAAYLSASAIPNFDALMSFIGTSWGPFFILLLPVSTKFYLLVHAFRRRERELDETRMTNEKESLRAGWMYDVWPAVRQNKRALWQGAFNVFLFLIGVFLTIGGMYGSVRAVIDANATRGGPFSCADNS